MDVFEDLCTENIVVMEFVEGIPLSRKEEILNNPDYDIEETIHNLVNSAIKSWFIDETEGHYFQADPHLSNILALPGGGVANIDCGLVQRLSRRETRICKNLMLAIYFKDTDRLVRVMTDMCGVDYRKYKDVLADDVTFYLEKVDDEGLGFWFFELTKIFVKHKIDYPTFMITLGRGNVILDGLISTYLPHYSTLDVLGRQLSKRANEHFRDTFDEKYFLRASYALIERAKIKFEKTDPFKESLQLLSDIAQAARGTYK
jgi:ubiquinone biosynthesis protein